MLGHHVRLVYRASQEVVEASNLVELWLLIVLEALQQQEEVEWLRDVPNLALLCFEAEAAVVDLFRLVHRGEIPMNMSTKLHDRRR